MRGRAPSPFGENSVFQPSRLPHTRLKPPFPRTHNAPFGRHTVKLRVVRDDAAIVELPLYSCARVFLAISTGTSRAFYARRAHYLSVRRLATVTRVFARFFIQDHDETRTVGAARSASLSSPTPRDFSRREFLTRARKHVAGCCWCCCGSTGDQVCEQRGSFAGASHCGDRSQTPAIALSSRIRRLPLNRTTSSHYLRRLGLKRRAHCRVSKLRVPIFSRSRLLAYQHEEKEKALTGASRSLYGALVELWMTLALACSAPWTSYAYSRRIYEAMCVCDPLWLWWAYARWLRADERKGRTAPPPTPCHPRVTYRAAHRPPLERRLLRL